MGRYRISQLAERVGVPATTLRYYESEGLLTTRRTPNGYRTYGDQDVERIRFITTAKDLGIPLARIRNLLGVWQDGMCRDVRGRLLPLVAEQLADLDSRMRDLQDVHRHLRGAQARLRALPARDEPCDPDCAFLTGDQTAIADRTGPTASVPIACSLGPDDHADRLARWRVTLAGTTTQQVDGTTVRVELPTERTAEIAALVADELACCPFFTFTLTVTHDGLRLDATAPIDARPLLDDLFIADPTGPRPC
ncbi:MerR family transcriptional regulator [Pseudonocardia kongjuensis]|uniref:MerR family transcriptional regulator n=1 Tax=Pseudonocardia kongjuensis TaxID=102227 RepID=A0ABP4I6V4_9PSEU